ncbi:hypothetical protein ACHAWF_017853 [Thalassiosira exigua]
MLAKSLFLADKIMGAGASSLLGKRGNLSLEKRIKYLQETPFFQYLTPDTINDFARCFPQTVRSNPGKSITLDPRRIYVVCEGEVDLSTSYPQEGTKIEAKGYLCRKRRGDIVNVCSTQEDVERRMTVKSQKMKGLAEDIMTVGSGPSGIVLLSGDMDALDKFNKAHPDLSKPIVEICTSQIDDRLLTIPFLQEVSKSKLGVLAAMCRYEAFDAGQTVFEEDSDADKLFLVLSGVAQVVAKSESTSSISPAEASSAVSEKSVTLQRSLMCSTKDSQRTVLAGAGTPDVTIAELKSGDYFGETALVFNIDRTCGVRTTEKCLFLTVHKTDFENFLKICPIEDSLKSVIKQRMVSKLSSLGIPFLDGIPQEMLSSLGSSVDIQEVPEGDTIFRQGDVGDKFYIIVHGAVKVDTVATPKAEEEACDTGDTGSGTGEETRTEEVCDESPAAESLGSLGPGQYFGEMSLVLNAESHLRTATVTSTQRSILLSIGKESFHELFGQHSNILAEFEIRLLKEMARLKHILAHSLGIVSFREFLEAEHAGENIDFWVAVKEFKANKEDDEQKRKEQARQIFVTFCAEYADRQVNLPHKMIGEIDGRLQSVEGEDVIPQDIFDDAWQEIFRLLEKDKFDRYKKSSCFKAFFAQIGGLSPEV